MAMSIDAARQNQHAGGIYVTIRRAEIVAQGDDTAVPYRVF